MRKYYTERFLNAMLQEVEKNTGKLGEILYSNLSFYVYIWEAKIDKKRVMVRVQPASGSGEDWINAWDIIFPVFDMDRLDKIYAEDYELRNKVAQSLGV